jgi:branched-subunit amino acid aminotransferase/4-amino-4-deoxychorismate lyase
MKKYCYANGKIELLAKAKVPVNDLAVLRGYGVFDFLKTVNGKPFLWPEHWARFLNSAKSLGLKVPVGESAARKIIGELLKKNRPAGQASKCADASIRLLLTGGAAEDGMTMEKSSFFILIEDAYHYPKHFFERGVKLISHEYLRLFPEAKTTNYITAIRLAPKKKQAGAVEILFTDHGRVLECSTSNFFIVKQGKIFTAGEDILGGATRNKVIELARAAGFAVGETEIKAKDLARAAEAFLTATNKNIMPVVQIDENKIANGKVGPVTKKLMTLWQNYLAGY